MVPAVVFNHFHQLTLYETESSLNTWSLYLLFPVIFFCLVSQTPSPFSYQKEFESIALDCVGLDILYIMVSTIMTCYSQVSFLDLNSTKISIYYWYSV